MPSRWDLLLDVKPIPLFDHLLEQVAKLLAKDFARWPLPVTEIEPAVARPFLDLLEEGSAPPSPAVYREAFTLAGFELSHEHEAFDEYMRNKRYLERGLAPTDRGYLLLLCRWLVDQLTGLAEATEGRVKRKHLLEVLDRVRTLGGWASVGLT